MTFLYREPVHAPLSIYAGWEDMGGVVVMKKLVMDLYLVSWKVYSITAVLSFSDFVIYKLQCRKCFSISICRQQI